MSRADSPEPRTPPFTRIHEDLALWLGEVAKSVRGDAPRLEARNFLLDEGVPEDRARSYLEHAGNTFDSTDRWVAGHEEYLRGEIFLPQPPNGIPKTLDPGRPDRCPETFRYEESFRAFGKAYRKLWLVRVQDVRSLANATGRTEADLVRDAREWLAMRQAGGPVEPELEDRLDATLHAWNQQCDLRPTYASFLVDHESLLSESPEGGEPDWADRLRDRLGLYHLAPSGPARPRPIFVFRYEVGSVPARKGLGQDRPLAVPGVLDSRLSPAFCPAPRDEPCGRVVALRTPPGGREPAREVLHPFRALLLSELYRVGEIRTPVPTDLGPARKAHLETLRRITGRGEYAAHTDPELDASPP